MPLSNAQRKFALQIMRIAKDRPDKLNEEQHNVVKQMRGMFLGDIIDVNAKKKLGVGDVVKERLKRGVVESTASAIGYTKDVSAGPMAAGVAVALNALGLGTEAVMAVPSKKLGGEKLEPTYAERLSKGRYAGDIIDPTATITVPGFGTMSPEFQKQVMNMAIDPYWIPGVKIARGVGKLINAGRKSKQMLRLAEIAKMAEVQRSAKIESLLSTKALPEGRFVPMGGGKGSLKEAAQAGIKQELQDIVTAEPKFTVADKPLRRAGDIDVEKVTSRSAGQGGEPTKIIASDKGKASPALQSAEEFIEGQERVRQLRNTIKLGDSEITIPRGPIGDEIAKVAESISSKPIVPKAKPLFTTKSSTEDALAIGKKAIGDEVATASLKENMLKHQAITRKALNEAKGDMNKLNEIPEKAHISQMYREAWEVATGKMSPEPLVKATTPKAATNADFDNIAIDKGSLNSGKVRASIDPPETFQALQKDIMKYGTKDQKELAGSLSSLDSDIVELQDAWKEIVLPKLSTGKMSPEPLVKATTPKAATGELESLSKEAQKYKSPDEFYEKVIKPMDSYAPEFRNPIIGNWRKTKMEPLKEQANKKGVSFSTNPIELERELDNVLIKKYTKEQLGNMSVSKKSKEVLGVSWEKRYREDILGAKNNPYRLIEDFWKESNPPKAATKEIPITLEFADGTKKTLTGKDFTKGIFKAIGDDITSKSSGITADPYRNLKKFLVENKAKLTDDEIAKIHNRAKVIGKTVAKAEQDNVFGKYLADNFPQIMPDRPVVIPTKPLGDVPISEATVSGVKDISGSKYLDKRAKIQDAQLHIRKLQERADVNVAPGGDRYNAEVRFHGRVGSRLENMQETLTSIDKGIVEASKKTGQADTELTKKVYTYLIAKHTPERNLVIGEKATGLGTEEARTIVRNIESGDDFVEVKKIADEIKDLNNQTLDILLDGQVIDKELHTFLRERYKDHIPLQRILDDAPDGEIGNILSGGQGFSVRSTGIKKAKGSELEIADILENVASNITQATIRAEKNVVNLHTLQFARENPHLGIFKEIKPKVIGTGAGKRPIFQPIDTSPKSSVLALRENGKPIYLEITDPVFAEAYKAVGMEKIPVGARWANTFSRFFSGLATRFNPEFPIPNIIRDTQEMAVYLASQKGFGLRKTAKAISKEPSSMADVMNAVWGKGDRAGAKLYKQMVNDGGTTGGMGLSTKKQVEISLDKIRKLNRSRPRAAANEVLKQVDNLNAVFEDATRLSAYKQALANGMSRERAAVIAKEATINFNRKGKYGPTINAFYMFANASIQGSTKMLKAMKNPKVATAVVSTIGVSTFAVNRYNDSIDPEWRTKVSDWDRMNSLPIMINTDKGVDYITIPVSWGVKPIKAMMDMVYDMSNGIDVGSARRIASKVSSSILDAYNPLGGTDVVQALTPSFADIPMDIARNKSWAGSAIRPEGRGSASKLYFNKLGDTKTGQFSIGATEELNKIGIDISPADMVYAIEGYIGGSGKFVSKVANTIGSIGSDMPTDARSIPFVNRFYKSIPEDKMEKISQYRKLNEEFFSDLIRENADESVERSRAANRAVEKVMATSDVEQRKEIVTSLYNSDQRTFETFIRYLKYQSKGLDIIERQVVDLNPISRAKWIKVELDGQKTLDDKKKRILDLQKKGIVTTDVLKELIKSGYKIK